MNDGVLFYFFSKVMALVVMIIAIVAKADAGTITDLLKAVDDDKGSSIPLYSTAVIILVVVSALVMLVTFLGCCGALRVKYYFLKLNIF